MMRGLKKVLAGAGALCVAAVLTVGGFGICAAADTETDRRIFDYADIYTDKEEAELQALAEYYEKQEEMAFIILTMNQTGDVGLLTEEFYYDAGYSFGYDDSGVVFAINMNEYNREFYIYWSEGAEKYFSDSELEDMLDDVEYHMADHRFADAGEEFFITAARNNDREVRVMGINPENFLMYGILAVVITAVVTLIAVSRQKSKVVTAGKDYQTGRTKINARSDMHTNTTRRVIHHSDSSSGSRGGTHHSSHSRGGGGGRRF